MTTYEAFPGFSAAHGIRVSGSKVGHENGWYVAVRPAGAVWPISEEGSPRARPPIGAVERVCFGLLRVFEAERSAGA